MNEFNLIGKLGRKKGIMLRTCFTCSGFEIPKPTATGLDVACSKEYNVTDVYGYWMDCIETIGKW